MISYIYSSYACTWKQVSCPPQFQRSRTPEVMAQEKPQAPGEAKRSVPWPATALLRCRLWLTGCRLSRQGVTRLMWLYSAGHAETRASGHLNLQAERDIVKKAAAFYAPRRPDSTPACSGSTPRARSVAGSVCASFLRAAWRPSSDEGTAGLVTVLAASSSHATLARHARLSR